MDFKKRSTNSSTEASLPQKIIDHYTGSKEIDDTKTVQLKGIFLSLDSDNDGQLSRPQLIEAVQMVGLIPRDSLIRKYMLVGNAFLKSKTENFVEDVKVDLSKSKKEKKISESMLFFKTSMTTFIDITLAELEKKSSDFSDDFSYLLSVIADGKTSAAEASEYVSIKDIRHVLHETMAPTRLSATEMTSFLRSSGIDFPKTFKIDEAAFAVDRNLLQNNLFVGKESKPIPLVAKK